MDLPAGKAVGQAHRSEQDPVGVSVGHLYQSHLYQKSPLEVRASIRFVMAILCQALSGFHWLLIVIVMGTRRA
jgi:hypothetical protein